MAHVTSQAVIREDSTYRRGERRDLLLLVPWAVSLLVSWNLPNNWHASETPSPVVFWGLCAWLYGPPLVALVP